MSLHDQIITVAVKDGNLVKWMFSAVYASPKVAFHNLLWSYLESVGAILDIPWLFLGDWNQVLDVSNKQGGCTINRFLKGPRWVQFI